VETDSLSPFPFSCIYPQVYVLLRVLAALEQRENRFVSVITSNTHPSLSRTMHGSLAYASSAYRDYSLFIGFFYFICIYL
jgi:hypothetical protein